jgi:hypothetical protein
LPASSVQTITALPLDFCAQNSRPIVMSLDTFPDAICATEYFVEYWSE